RVPVRPSPRWTGAHLAAVCISLVLGAITHVAWDSFTHSDGIAVLQLTFLRRPMLALFGLKLAPYQLLQLASTLLGMGLLARWVLRWRDTTAPVPGSA